MIERKDSEGEPAVTVQACPDDSRVEGQDDFIGLAAAEAEVSAAAASEPADQEAEPTGSPRAPREGPWEQELPEKLVGIMDRRIDIWGELLALQERRDRLLDGNLDPGARDELIRQRDELKRLPGLPQLQQVQQDIEARVQALAAADADQDVDVAADAEEAHREALGMGMAQATWLATLGEFDRVVPHAAAPAVAQEPVVLLCRRHGIESEVLVGWTFYALAVQQRVRDLHASEEARRALRRELDNSRGRFGRVRQMMGIQQSADGAAASRQLPDMRATLAAAERELNVIKPAVARLFWPFYEEVACLFVSGAVQGPEATRLRALLRYGMVTVCPGLVDHEVTQHILADCENDIYIWENTRDSCHVVYPDEYLEMVHLEMITPGPDEDMELNERATPAWKADRIMRRVITACTRQQLCQAEIDELDRCIARLTDVRTEHAEGLDNLRQNKSDKLEIDAKREELRSVSTLIAHHKRSREILIEKTMPELGCHRPADDDTLATFDAVLPPERRMRREAQLIRRLARLCAQLHECHPQLMLTEAFSPGRGDHLSRLYVQDTVRDLEKRDRQIFHQVLIPGKALDSQFSMRLCPTILIVPACGARGLSANPRKMNDSGQLVLPLISSRPDLLERMLIDILADFRWDSSREEAGLDWIMADALCANYAEVRWHYRNMHRKSREKAAIDRKLTHRQNWRLHYRLWMGSAMDQGRRLFYTCREVYEVFMHYVGMPEGLQPMQSDTRPKFARRR